MLLPFENQRLRKLIEIKKFGSVNAFAVEIGLTATAINRFFNVDKRNKTCPSVLNSPAVLKAIQNKYPEIDVNWFKFGEVEKERDNTPDDKIESLTNEVDSLKGKMEDMKQNLKMLYSQLLFLQESFTIMQKNNANNNESKASS